MKQTLLTLYGLNPLTTFRFQNGKKNYYVCNQGVNTGGKRFVYIKECGKDNYRLLWNNLDRKVVFVDFVDGAPIYTRI